MIILIIFLFGLFVGSFLNVLVDRLPKGETVIKGRSHCEFCKKDLQWFDLIPVLSFVFLKGKCRYCRHSLSSFYPVIEITTAVMFALTYLMITNFNLLIFSPQALITFIYYLFLMSSFIVIFFTDLKYGIIPDKILLFAVIVNSLYLIFINHQLALANLLSGLGAFLFFLIIYLVFSFFAKKAAMGGGDIKLAFLLGLFLGFPNIIISLYLAFLTGAISGIILILWSKKSFQNTTLAFGPFLILGAVISLFFGNLIYLQALHFLGF